MEACRLGHARTATLLLEHGANVHYQNKVYLSVFSLMLIDNDWYILFHKFGQSALWRSSATGRTECVEVLLKYGALVDSPVRYDMQKWI